MNGAFYIGALGMDAQQRALDVIANNIANMSTPGFKRSAVRFSEIAGVGGGTDPAVGVGLAAVSPVWSQGDIKPTSNPHDLAIDGDGFLEVMGPSGQALLWRGGTLKVNDDGALATSDGLPLKSAVNVPVGADALAIARDGTVSAVDQGQKEPRVIGQLDLVLAKDPASLVDAGGGYWRLDDATELSTVRPGEEGSGTFVQGAIESANVQLTDEMVNLLVLQRAYAANAQVVQSADQLMSIVNGLRR